jgi:hypothetical protein
MTIFFCWYPKKVHRDARRRVFRHSHDRCFEPIQWNMPNHRKAKYER